MGCYVSTLGSGMHCSTPQTTMPRWLCGMFMVQITSLRNGSIVLNLIISRWISCVACDPCDAGSFFEKYPRHRKVISINKRFTGTFVVCSFVIHCANDYPAESAVFSRVFAAPGPGPQECFFESFLCILKCG